MAAEAEVEAARAEEGTEKEIEQVLEQGQEPELGMVLFHFPRCSSFSLKKVGF